MAVSTKIDHYTAVVTITKTTITEDSYSSKEQSRDTPEVAKIVVKGKTLETLRTRLGSHVALIEED